MSEVLILWEYVNMHGKIIWEFVPAYFRHPKSADIDWDFGMHNQDEFWPTWSVVREWDSMWFDAFTYMFCSSWYFRSLPKLCAKKKPTTVTLFLRRYPTLQSQVIPSKEKCGWSSVSHAILQLPFQLGMFNIYINLHEYAYALATLSYSF